MNRWVNRLTPSTPPLLPHAHPDSGGAVAKRDDERMLLQKAGERPLELPGAVSVDQPHDPLIGQQRLVEEPLGPGDRFVDGAPDHVQVGRRRRRGCSCTLTLIARRRSAAPPMTRRSRTLARIRLPRTSRSAVPSWTRGHGGLERQARRQSTRSPTAGWLLADCTWPIVEDCRTVRHGSMATASGRCCRRRRAPRMRAGAGIAASRPDAAPSCAIVVGP